MYVSKTQHFFAYQWVISSHMYSIVPHYIHCMCPNNESFHVFSESVLVKLSVLKFHCYHLWNQQLAGIPSLADIDIAAGNRIGAGTTNQMDRLDQPPVLIQVPTLPRLSLDLKASCCNVLLPESILFCHNCFRHLLRGVHSEVALLRTHCEELKKKHSISINTDSSWQQTTTTTLPWHTQWAIQWSLVLRSHWCQTGPGANDNWVSVIIQYYHN